MKVIILNDNPKSENIVFDKDIIYQLAQPQKLSKFDFWLYKSIGKKFYWNIMLKKNIAYNNRFDRPYVH